MDQAASDANLRRRAVKPTRPKPMISIAQVAGSGTEARKVEWSGAKSAISPIESRVQKLKPKAVGVRFLSEGRSASGTTSVIVEPETVTLTGRAPMGATENDLRNVLVGSAEPGGLIWLNATASKTMPAPIGVVPVSKKACPSPRSIPKTYWPPGVVPIVPFTVAVRTTFVPDRTALTEIMSRSASLGPAYVGRKSHVGSNTAACAAPVLSKETVTAAAIPAHRAVRPG